MRTKAKRANTKKSRILMVAPAETRCDFFSEIFVTFAISKRYQIGIQTFFGFTTSLTKSLESLHSCALHLQAIKLNLRRS